MFRRMLSPISFVLVAMLLGLVWPMAEGTQARTVTAHGCTVNPLTPDNDHGQLVARATVRCTTNMEGRFVVIELHQGRAGSDHVYEPVWGASATLEAPEQLDDATYEADGNPVACRAIDGVRRFKTVVIISNAGGHFRLTESGDRTFGFDCLEGDQTVPVSESEDEVIEDACTGDFCTEAHLENTKRLYGCLVRSRNPVALDNRLVGEGRFECDTRLDKRFVYVKVCDDVARAQDSCTGTTSRYLDRRNAKWTGSPYCIATSITTFPPFEYRGTYSRTGIDPGKQGDGANPQDRHVNSPRTPFNSDCSRVPLG